MFSSQLLDISKRILALAQTGLTYSGNPYDIERYEELRDISHTLMSSLSGQPVSAIQDFHLNNKEYPTPKTDLRAVIFNERQEILLVQEKSDHCWALPGGWAEIGLTPSESLVKEVSEETGLMVEPVRLLAVLDKKKHPHPPQLEYVYKLFIECRVLGGQFKPAHDIVEAGYFSKSALPPLSEIRVVRSQIELMFSFLEQPGRWPVLD